MSDCDGGFLEYCNNSGGTSRGSGGGGLGYLVLGGLIIGTTAGDKALLGVTALGLGAYGLFHGAIKIADYIHDKRARARNSREDSGNSSRDCHEKTISASASEETPASDRDDEGRYFHGFSCNCRAEGRSHCDNR